MLQCYRFEVDFVELYEEILANLLKDYCTYLNMILVENKEKMLRVFIMDNLFVIFANYFEIEDVK